MSCGDKHTCGIREDDGKIDCWGQNDMDQSTVTNPDIKYVQVSCGYSHCCVIHAQDFHVHCWGDNGQQQASAPVDTPFIQVTCGQFHTVILIVFIIVINETCKRYYMVRITIIHLILFLLYVLYYHLGF